MFEAISVTAARCDWTQWPRHMANPPTTATVTQVRGVPPVPHHMETARTFCAASAPSYGNGANVLPSFFEGEPRDNLSATFWLNSLLSVHGELRDMAEDADNAASLPASSAGNPKVLSVSSAGNPEFLSPVWLLEMGVSPLLSGGVTLRVEDVILDLRNSLRRLSSSRHCRLKLSLERVLHRRVLTLLRRALEHWLQSEADWRCLRHCELKLKQRQWRASVTTCNKRFVAWRRATAHSRLLLRCAQRLLNWRTAQRYLLWHQEVVEQKTLRRKLLKVLARFRKRCVFVCLCVCVCVWAHAHARLSACMCVCVGLHLGFRI